MAKQSAGLLLYRQAKDGIEVFLVHPGGPFWRKRDEGSWSIPKGEREEGEDGLSAALRELGEETGVEPCKADWVGLGSVRQRGGKVVEAWAGACDVDADRIRSNTFTMEWPPGSGRTAAFPEIDRASWFDLETARRRINAAQQPFLDRLSRLLAGARG